ncbi:MAG: Rieske 2Fe-2S domain-containing protein [Chloroflexi bacterium]|nr:Rieske 2Fe-2S domain-containing protein [Chloroflexota bacterium]
MLSREENELLTRTGPGTPMGNLYRRFWLPALLPDELPNADSDPIRFRILGEDLVAFRDTNGKVGFIQNNCPHRGASLFFGRNEEAGLRCVYHGWKFDVEGNCIDMPNEPAESDFKQKVKATAYPSAELGGFVWIYMGPPEKQPALPNYHWCTLPDANRSQVRKWMQESNYSQGVEGDLDSAHVSFLHRKFGQQERPINYGAPRLTTMETDFGFAYGARRPSGDDYFWRVTTFVLPMFISIPGAKYPGSGHFTLPMDDEHSWWFVVEPPPLDGVSWVLKPGQLTPGDADPAVDPTNTFIPGTWRRVRNKDNDYLIDRQRQKTYNYTGLPGNRVEDAAMTESMGPIYDRTQEHLGTTDVAIIFWRRMMMRMARNLEKGIEPAILSDPNLFRAVPLQVTSPESDFGELWTDHHNGYKRSLVTA